KDGGDTWRELDEEGDSQKLSDEQIIELGNLVGRLEKFFGFPVDVEWALAGGKFYVLQSRPVTAL
ncbi:MAG: PEP/pyruvate-binding domain-containing protein, partial [Acidobacteriota bacterium]